MYEPNVARVLSMLAPQDVVLDIGGWGSPFNRADYVLDAQPYATRGFYRNFGGKPFQGPEREHFTEATWIVQDVCGPEPYPFADKSIDFVICSHTLEDIRDPLRVCAEMVRIAKRGYIEVPSRLFESCRGVEMRRMAGLSHHRWLVDLEGDTLVFLPKFHRIHFDHTLSFSPRFYGRLPEEAKVTWLFWDGSFGFEERLLDDTWGEMRAYVHSMDPERASGALVRAGQRLRQFGERVRGGLGRRLRRSSPLDAATLAARQRTRPSPGGYLSLGADGVRTVGRDHAAEA